MSVEGNDIILDPAQMLPPPRMRGHITAVSVQGDEIVRTFGTARKTRVWSVSFLASTLSWKNSALIKLERTDGLGIGVVRKYGGVGLCIPKTYGGIGATASECA
jgi:hypothetical protein